LPDRQNRGRPDSAQRIHAILLESVGFGFCDAANVPQPSARSVQSSASIEAFGFGCRVTLEGTT
jgi:hypothetical protein